MKKGRVYIVTNPAFPHLFKIGRTSKDAVEKRGLSASNIPEDFKTEREFECDDTFDIENLFHENFEIYRHYTATGRRTEFFYITCFNKAVRLLDTMRGLTDITDKTIEEDIMEVENDDRYDEEKVVETKSKIRAKWALHQYGLKIGDELVLDRGNNIRATVINETEIQLVDDPQKIGSLSRLSWEAYQKLGRRGFNGGPFHWRFNGKRLWDIRLEKERN